MHIHYRLVHSAIIWLIFFSAGNITEPKHNDLVQSDDFFDAVPQELTERQIKKELTSLKSVNISSDLNVYQAYLLASTSQNITIFDKPNFGFYQFDTNLKYTGKFGTEGRGPGEFIHPMDIITDQQGNYLVIDGRQHRVSILSTDGELVDEYNLPSGIIPHRYTSLGSSNYALFSLAGTNAFHIINDNGHTLNSFFKVNTENSITFRQRGFLLDGYITGKEEMVYHAGNRTSMLKAFNIHGELIYSREYIQPLKHDILNMENQELRTAPHETSDIAVYGDKLVLLNAGKRDDPNRLRYLDIYNRANGDYLFTYLLEKPALKIDISESTNSLIVLGHYDEIDDMGLYIYENPL